MSKSSGREGVSHSRRRSLFTLSSLTQINPSTREDGNVQQPAKSLKKRKAGPPLQTSLGGNAERAREDSRSPISVQSSPKLLSRPSLNVRPSLTRPASSVFGSLKSIRSSAEDDAPLTACSSKAPSVNWAEVDGATGRPRAVAHHGEVQTSSTMFRKKKEYLVLTDTHLVRCKNQAKASEAFAAIPSPFGRSPTIKYGSAQSVNSTQDLQSLGSDSSGDKEGRIPLRQVVATHKLDDGRPYYAMEVCYMDEDSNHAAAMTLQFVHPEERDVWLKAVRSAAGELRLREPRPISAHNANYTARLVERESDYDPTNFALYKVIQRHASKSGARSSTDDLSKIASTVCFLAVGIHKVHVIPLSKGTARASSPSLVHSGPLGSYGLLTLTSLTMSSSDDSFELTFRQPLQRPVTLTMAALTAQDIACHLHHMENRLRPECAHRLFRLAVPPRVEKCLLPPVNSEEEEHCCLERTLTAYCISYGVNPEKIRYTINYTCEDAPRFELLPAASSRRQAYSVHELLAIMRALRYNESFGSISFADNALDRLNGLHDNHGSEHICSQTKRGAPIRLTTAEMSRSCLLVQEIRALAVTSKRLRRMDFSGCITTIPNPAFDENNATYKDEGCGIVEALFPLCRYQTTNVDWIALNGIILSDTDLDYLVGAAVDRACHFRAIELSRCGLNDRSLGMVLDALRAQDNTLEALNIAGNNARLSPAVFDNQISVFGFIRKLDLSHLARTSGPEALLPAETLLTWRLEELRLSGTNVNEKTVEALSVYLQSPQSDTLHELYLDQAYLSGSDIATLMQAMSHRTPQLARTLHLDISHNKITKNHHELVKAFENSQSPTHLTMRAIEYRDEAIFRSLVHSICKNHSTQYLDISRASLPSDASDETSQALETLFAENDTLEELDISGEDSRLEISKFGVGLNRALSGLKRNTRLHILRIQYQKLGLPGAGTLADVLKENDTLREIHCEFNDIPLPGLTDMINTLGQNTTLVHLPLMEEGRSAALKQTERQVKQIRDETPISPTKSPTSPTAKAPSGFGVRRSLASVRRNVNRTASAYTPSFPSFPSSSSSTTTTATTTGSETRSTSSPMPSGPPSPYNGAQKSKLNPQLPTAVASSAAGAAAPPTLAPLLLSDQDIQAALRLVAEAWDRQQYRLQQYLQRNWCLLQGIPTAMEIEEEDFERSDGVGCGGNMGSLAKVLERVQIDRTPTTEKELDFGAAAEHLSLAAGQGQDQGQGSGLAGPMPLAAEDHDLRDGGGGADEGEQTILDFKEFMSESLDREHGLLRDETRSPDDGMMSPDDEDAGMELGLGIRAGSGTPTQMTFFG